MGNQSDSIRHADPPARSDPARGRPAGRQPTMSLQADVSELAAPGRAARFLAVGATGAVLDMALLAALHGRLGVALLPAKVLAAEAAIVLMFVVNDQWTFADESGRDSAARRLLSSNAVRLAGLATGTGILLALDGIGVWYVLANGVGLGAGFVVNYAFESVVTWQVLG